MSMTITDSSDRDDEIEIDDDQILDGDDDEDRPKPKSKARQQPDDDDTDADDDEEPEDGWAAEAKRLRAALKKSNATGLRRRNQLKALKAAESKADPDDDVEDDDEDDEEKPKQKKQADVLDARSVERRIEKARREERKRAEAEHTRDLIDTRAETALARAGADDKAIRLLKRELDYDELELLKDRSVEGLDDEIDRLKTEFPNLFRSKSGARRRINGGDDREGGKKRPMSVNARQLAQLRGTAR